MQPARLDLCVIQGATLRKPLLMMQPTYGTLTRTETMTYTDGKLTSIAVSEVFA